MELEGVGFPLWAELAGLKSMDKVSAAAKSRVWWQTMIHNKKQVSK